MQGILTVSFLAVAIIAGTTSSPIKRSCQTNKDVRALLIDGLGSTRGLYRQSSRLSQEMARRWPTDPYQGSNVDFFIHPQSFNKTADKPVPILKANCQILRRFIALLDNSTKQLSRFQVAEGVKSQMELLKERTKILISCLRRIMTIINFQQRGQKGANKPTSREDQKINSSNAGSPTIQDVTFRTKLILDEFSSNTINLITDLKKIKTQTCY